MPFLRNEKLPGEPGGLTLPAGESKLFLVFVSSIDSTTGQPWCPDVRAALPNLEAVFGGEGSPKLTVVEVGQKPEWKDAGNVFRTVWNIRGVPTLVRYEAVNGAVAETGRLGEEDELLDKEILSKFIV